MSRDIVIQDIPAGALSVADLKDDWEPRPLPFDRQKVIETVVELVPTADFSDPGWGHVDLPDVHIEVSLRDESPLKSFALHVRGSDTVRANKFIADLLGRLGVRGFDPDEESGIFGSE